MQSICMLISGRKKGAGCSAPFSLSQANKLPRNSFAIVRWHPITFSNRSGCCWGSNYLPHSTFRTVFTCSGCSTNRHTFKFSVVPCKERGNCVSPELRQTRLFSAIVPIENPILLVRFFKSRNDECSVFAS